jgi:hypothetical protein
MQCPSFFGYFWAGKPVLSTTKEEDMRVAGPVTSFSVVQSLNHTAKTQYQKFEIFPEKELHSLSPNFHIHVSLSALYVFQDLSAYSAAGKYVDRPWEHINRSQTHECGNWD